MEFQIRFKVLVLTFKAIRGLGPVYLRDCLSQNVHQRALRSSGANLLYVPGTKDIRSDKHLIKPYARLMGLKKGDLLVISSILCFSFLNILIKLDFYIVVVFILYTAPSPIWGEGNDI